MSSVLQETQRTYQYRECGLDNVWLDGGFEESESPYGRTITIQDVDGLHKCIADCLVNKPGPLIGAEFKFLRTELDLSQSTMAGLCGRQERTIREWESREGAVDDNGDQLIRFVYMQRFNASAKYEEVSRQIRHLQALDKQLFELKLRIKNQHGWTAEPCRIAA